MSKRNKVTRKSNLVEQARQELDTAFANTRPGTQERFDPVDRIEAKYDHATLERAFPFDIELPGGEIIHVGDGDAKLGTDKTWCPERIIYDPGSASSDDVRLVASGLDSGELSYITKLDIGVSLRAVADAEE